MRIELSKRFRFEAAHRLPNTPEGHKCRRLHGHSFEAEITVAGEVEEGSGWLMDFAAIQAAIAPLRATLDHNYLNEIEGLENPTSELLAGWIWQRLLPALPGLAVVEIAETCSSRCVYRGG